MFLHFILFDLILLYCFYYYYYYYFIFNLILFYLYSKELYFVLFKNAVKKNIYFDWFSSFIIIIIYII